MLKYFRKNQKQLLAIFAAGLMIAFIIPTFGRRGDGVRDYLWARMGDTKIYATEVMRAREHWELLCRNIMVQQEIPTGIPGLPRFNWAPISWRLGEMIVDPRTNQPINFAVIQIEQRPELFLLLQKEARAMGLEVSPLEVENLLRSGEVHIANLDMNRDQDRVRAAIEAFLLVQLAYERSASVVKVSEPFETFTLATRWQAISLDLVEFPADEQAATRPSTQEAYDQFIAFGNKSADDPDAAANPFGFGYRYPDRLKFEAISVPRQRVREAVETSRDARRWEVEAWKYYTQHPEQFPSTQPVPTTQLSLGPVPSSALTPSTQPATRPFEEVREDVFAKMRQPLIDKLSEDIQNRIAAIMGADWLVYKRAGGTTRAATAPTSSMGVPYDSPEYLNRLADAIQKQFNVRPNVSAYNDTFRSARQLGDLEPLGISRARVGNVDFSTYATLREGSDALAPYQPSRLLKDYDDSVYLFRLTAIDPAHMPADKAEVQAQIERDWSRRIGFEKAKAAAELFLNAASSQGFESAAQTAGKKIINTGTFSNHSQAPIPDYALNGPGRATFIADAFKLLSEAARSNNPHPMAVIEIPRAGKVVVARLSAVKPMWTDEMAFIRKLQAREEIRGELRMPLQRDWFSFDNVAARLQYKPERTENRPLPRPAQPAMPIF